ncbi:MAG: hypothetical protein ACI9G1_003174 [Pirellulaceae bacterium]
MENRPNSNEPRTRLFKPVTLISIIVSLSIMCVMFALTRHSPLVSAIVVLAIFAAIVTLFIRQLRGEIVILVMVALPLFIAAVAFFVLFLAQ